MEFANIIIPLTKNICRTCLAEPDPNTMFMSIQDLIEHEINKIKLIDILVFLNCVENNDEENWPKTICSSCVSTALVAYNFKLDCLKANATLSQIFTLPNQSSPSDLARSDIDSIDINVVYQDHEYDVPLFGNNSLLEFESNNSNNKDMTTLTPVNEITSTKLTLQKVGEKKYACTLCPRLFTRIYGLRHHMAKHENIRKYLCQKCGRQFFTSSGLSQHLISHKDYAQYKCEYCNKGFKSRQYLKEHFCTACSSNRKSFTCVTCGKSFTAKSTLNTHIKSHNGQNYFACPYCPKTYTRAAYLRAHCIIHTGQARPRPFLCKYKQCCRNFSTKYSLLVHIAHAHRTDRPFKCDKCNKGFATRSGLKIHQDSHTNQKIECNICGKKLASKRVLQKHLRVHDVDPNDMILETVVDSEFFDVDNVVPYV